MKRYLAAGLAAFLLLPLSAGKARAQTPIDGTWEISWDMEGGARSITLDLAKEGNVITGTAQMQGMMGSESDEGRKIPIAQGRIEGDYISFTIPIGNGEGGMQGMTDNAERVMQFNGVVGSHGVMGGFLTGASMMQGVMTGAEGRPAMEIPFKGFRR